MFFFFFFLLPLIVHVHVKCIQGYTVTGNTARFQEAVGQLASSADILGCCEMEACGGRREGQRARDRPPRRVLGPRASLGSESDGSDCSPSVRKRRLKIRAGGSVLSINPVTNRPLANSCFH